MKTKYLILIILLLTSFKLYALNSTDMVKYLEKTRKANILAKKKFYKLKAENNKKIEAAKFQYPTASTGTEVFTTDVILAKLKSQCYLEFIFKGKILSIEKAKTLFDASNQEIRNLFKDAVNFWDKYRIFPIGIEYLEMYQKVIQTTNAFNSFIKVSRKNRNKISAAYKKLLNEEQRVEQERINEQTANYQKWNTPDMRFIGIRFSYSHHFTFNQEGDHESCFDYIDPAALAESDRNAGKQYALTFGFRYAYLYSVKQAHKIGFTIDLLYIRHSIPVLYSVSHSKYIWTYADAFGLNAMFTFKYKYLYVAAGGYSYFRVSQSTQNICDYKPVDAGVIATIGFVLNKKLKLFIGLELRLNLTNFIECFDVDDSGKLTGRSDTMNYFSAGFEISIGF